MQCVAWCVVQQEPSSRDAGSLQPWILLRPPSRAPQKPAASSCLMRAAWSCAPLVRGLGQNVYTVQDDVRGRVAVIRVIVVQILARKSSR